MDLRRTLSIMRKETWHILRDRRTFILVTLSPVFLLLVFGYSMSVEIRNVAVAILDHDQSALSRRYRDGLASTGDIRILFSPRDYDDLRSRLERRQAKAAVVIPAGFEDDLLAGREASLQVIVDGTDPSTANHAMTHIAGYTQSMALEIVREALERQGVSADQLTSIDLRMRTWYNPTLKPIIGWVPGLIASVLGMPAVAATLALTAEKEKGTLEALIATPVRRSELLIGKLIPYVLSGLVSAVLCALVGIYWFGAPFRGSPLLYLLLSADFFLATLSIGLLISVFVPSQQAAMVCALLIFLFPGFFMSGLFYPIASMPPMMKMEAYMMPTTHYVTIARGLFLKGLDMHALWPFALALFVMGVLVTSAAILTFKKRLA
ncbi:MAG: ABC transporter permease [Anaerolineae bacterium]|nr:ABC transporter permease [Anaerolineae bacterium]NIN99509.1 ABC transporter permease [Anaerolineae bacterium]NIQ82373.1 ABC transporter permease [Anaerolineae bacterium]